MAEKAKKNNKNIMYGLCAAVVVVVVVIVIAFFTLKGQTIDDSYFVSDGSKYVVTLDSDDIGSDDEYAPLKTHMVYFYSGDKITGLKSYYEYADADTAKTAHDAVKAAGQFDSFKSVSLNGKYIVVEANESEYENYTADQIKSLIDSLENLKTEVKQ